MTSTTQEEKFDCKHTFINTVITNILHNAIWIAISAYAVTHLDKPDPNEVINGACDQVLSQQCDILMPSVKTNRSDQKLVTAIGFIVPIVIYNICRLFWNSSCVQDKIGVNRESIAYGMRDETISCKDKIYHFFKKHIGVSLFFGVPTSSVALVFLILINKNYGQYLTDEYLNQVCDNKNFMSKVTPQNCYGLHGLFANTTGIVNHIKNLPGRGIPSSLIYIALVVNAFVIMPALILYTPKLMAYCRGVPQIVGPNDASRELLNDNDDDPYNSMIGIENNPTN